MNEKRHSTKNLEIMTLLTTKAAEFRDSSDFHRIESKLEVKLFYHRYHYLFIFCSVSVFILHLFSISTSYIFTQKVFFGYFKTLSESVFYSIIALVIIEVFKHLLVSLFFENWFIYRTKSGIVFMLVCACIGLSLYLSASGTSAAYEANSKPPFQYDIEKMVANDSAEIKGYQKQLTQIANTQSWDNGNLTPQGREATIAVLSYLTLAKNRCQVTRDKYVKLNNQLDMEAKRVKLEMSNKFSLFAIVFDLALIFCIWFKWYFTCESRKEVLLMSQIEASEPIKEVIEQESTPTIEIIKVETRDMTEIKKYNTGSNGQYIEDETIPPYPSQNRDSAAIEVNHVKLNDVNLMSNKAVKSSSSSVNLMSNKKNDVNLNIIEEGNIEAMKKERDSLSRKMSAYKKVGYGNELPFTENMQAQITRLKYIKSALDSFRAAKK
jgi:hypothetical protein